MEFVSTQDGVFPIAWRCEEYSAHKQHNMRYIMSGLWSPLQLVFDNRRLQT